MILYLLPQNINIKLYIAVILSFLFGMKFGVICREKERLSVLDCRVLR